MGFSFRGSVSLVSCDLEYGCLLDGAGRGVRVSDDFFLILLFWGGGTGCIVRFRVGFFSFRVWIYWMVG